MADTTLGLYLDAVKTLGFLGGAVWHIVRLEVRLAVLESKVDDLRQHPAHTEESRRE